jgi:methionine-rich copper-binding protein CopC
VAPRPSTIRRRLPAAVAIAALAAAAPPAAAHTELRSTTPGAGAVLAEAPATITATYEQPLGRVDGARVTVGGRRVATGVAGLAPGDARRVVIPLTGDPPAGAYRVAWTVIGADGHALAGELAFRVRRPAVIRVVSGVGALVARAGRAIDEALDADG